MTIEQLYQRAIAGALDVDEDHGTAVALLVPYAKPAPIVEWQPGRGRVAYTEVMHPGVADRAVRSGAGRLPLVYDHSDSFADRMGVATKVWEQTTGDDAGLYAALRFDRSRLEQAMDAVTSSHGGISIAFHSVVPRAFTEREGSTVDRRSIILKHIAAVVTPAYADARLLAVRDGEEEAGEPTEAEQAEAARRLEIAATLREAAELVEAGRRWDQFRAEGQ